MARAKSVSDSTAPSSLGDGIVTSHHQHFFCARLDLDVDGARKLVGCEPAVDVVLLVFVHAGILDHKCLDVKKFDL